MTSHATYSLQPPIGEIYMMQFGAGGCDSEQRGWRPGIVFQNNVGNAHSPNIVALPLTSSLKKQGQPTHVVLPADRTGLLRDSMVLCENPESMSKSKIGKYLATVPPEYMQKIAVANLLASSAISFVDFDVLLEAWKTAKRLNFSVVS